VTTSRPGPRHRAEHLEDVGPQGACRPVALRDLSAAVLDGEDTDELLELLADAALQHTGAPTITLALPQGQGTWSLEVVAGEDRALLLGSEFSGAEDGPLAAALCAQDAPAAEEIDTVVLEGRTYAAAVATADLQDQGFGAMLALDRRPAATFGPEQVIRLQAIAMLLVPTLTGIRSHTADDLQDERTRIASDLHDLAIQELFAVGMQLEELTRDLADSSHPISNAVIRRRVETSVHGVENAVTQIRQIVQSLRRERPEASLSERLRHEVGMATSGLGFVPTLRLPEDPAAMDAEIPPEIAEDVVAVVRECLANAARHAHASAVAVSITLLSEGVDRVVQVSVSDNGRGIDPTVTRRSGLANMSSRARRHSGWVDASSLEPGTMITWRVTLPPEE
jgi:signal transduction histidine kinase